MSIRVAIADDHQILVAALQAMLGTEPDIAVVGTAGDGTALLKLVAQTKPDVVIMDIGMPGMNGIEATQRLTTGRSAAKVIVLSGYTDKRFVLEALNAGAAGYVIKSSAGSELPRAIRSVAKGQTYLCPEVAGAVVETMRNGNKHDAKAANSRLAPRERMIVRLLAEGKNSAQIAAALHIAVSTVDTHRRNIMRKLEMHSVAEITRYAIREGIATA
jgi:two-component system NarL family response regulator